MLWSGLISFIHVLGEIANRLIAAASGAYILLMSDLTHRSLACKAHLNMLIENAQYKFITITITITEVGVDQSTFRLAGHVDRSHLIVLKMKKIKISMLFSYFSCSKSLCIVICGTLI